MITQVTSVLGYALAIAFTNSPPPDVRRVFPQRLKEWGRHYTKSGLGLEQNILTFNSCRDLPGSLPLYLEHLCLPNTHLQVLYSLDSGIRSGSSQEQ